VDARDKRGHDSFIDLPALTAARYALWAEIAPVIARSGSDEAIQLSNASWIASRALAMTRQVVWFSSSLNPQPAGRRFAIAKKAPLRFVITKNK